MRTPAPFAFAALLVVLGACGRGSPGDVTADGPRCRAGLPVLVAELAPPLTTMATMPGQPPVPIVRYVFAGPAPQLPADAVAYCFDPSLASRRERALRVTLGVGPDDELTISTDDDRAWQFLRAGPTPPFGTTVPGAPPSATTVADVSEASARATAARVLEALETDVSRGRLDVGGEVGRWWARFVPEVGGEALATSLEIGPGGDVLSGSGHLGTPVEAGRYPLVDAATALARANAPLDELAAATARSRVDVALDEAVVVPALRRTEAGTYLVPTVRFDGAGGSTASTPVVGVSDRFVRAG